MCAGINIVTFGRSRDQVELVSHDQLRRGQGRVVKCYVPRSTHLLLIGFLEVFYREVETMVFIILSFRSCAD